MDKSLPSARRTGDLPLQGSALQGEGVEAIGEMESQEDSISETLNAPFSPPCFHERLDTLSLGEG